MSDTIVFIDKGFLDVLSKYFGNGVPIKYDFVKLANNLAKEQDLKCIKTFLYLAPPFQSNNPTKEEKLRKEKYDKFKNKLIKNSFLILREGRVQRIKENDSFIYKQKGVDNLLTKDLCFVQRDYPDIEEIILISSDSDFAPILEELKESGLDVILYNYFEKKRNSKFSISNHLISSVSKWVQLEKKHLLEASLE